MDTRCGHTLFGHATRVTCIVATRPYLTPPILTRAWQTAQTFNIVDTRPINADAGADFGL
eukprot:12502949-Ditylum_brightwellii.AAC.1